MKKYRLYVGLALIVMFSVALFQNFGNSISTYVNFKEAEAKGKTAHVVGTWVKESPAEFSMESMTFKFRMRDEAGNECDVVYAKPKPSNFDQADRIVVIGEVKGGRFYASDMLLKCPSKYNDATPAQFEKAS